MFDVYTTEPQILNDPDAEALASQLDRNGLSRLAGRVRYGFTTETLVEVDPTEHGFLVEALEAAINAGAATSEQAVTVAQNLRARIAAGDPEPPSQAQSIRIPT
jgi:hypothetical protein